MKMRNALWPFIVASLFVGSPLLAKEKKPIKVITDHYDNELQTSAKIYQSRKAPTQSHTVTDGDNALKAKRSK